MAEFISSMLNLLLISLKTTLVNIFVLAGPGLVFVLLMDIVSAEVQKNEQSPQIPTRVGGGPVSQVWQVGV